MPINIHTGDCLQTLKTLESESVHTCVTSPPYFGLRDYGHDGQIGLEETPEAFVTQLVEVFREVRRVLRKDGTLWLNLGDSYARQAGDDSTKNPDSGLKTGRTGRAKELFQTGCNKPPQGLKPKDLIGIPWRVAFALQADGWYLRQDIIWHKPNPMPESVKDRCTKAHEYIFLLSKSPKYYFDADAIKEPCSENNVNDFLKRKTLNNNGKGKGTYDEARPDLTRSRECHMPKDFKRNRRSVWTVTTKPFKGAHFATFPPDLIEPCVIAGAPVGGTVLDPFSGAGTTGLVSAIHGRNYIGCELNPEYAEMSKTRIANYLLKDFEV
jgi:DNA modification methylase